MLLVVCLATGALAQVSACSSTSNGAGADRDAATRADGPPASLDSAPPRDAGSDTGADAPVNVTSVDAAGSLLDSPLAQDRTQDARVLVDEPGRSSDLATMDSAQPDAKPSQDSKAAGRDSAPHQDAAAADVRLPDGGAEARGDTGMTPVADPGIPVYTSTRAGTGPCAGKTVRSLIDQIGAADPTFSGLPLYGGADSTDRGAVYAFARGEVGFSLVFKYGSGDCPSGCIDHEYWYFQTDADCVPRQVGHYFQQSSRACGTPMWGVPANPVAPSTEVCP